VGDLGIDDERLTNNIALQRLQQPANFREPGQKYQYSNTGYLLLATIVERVSGQKFVAFVRQKILQPLAMTNTSISGQAFGMGDMHSTVDDLLKWEQSFYTENLVRKSTLDSAFTPYPVREGNSTYGFGWNIADRNGDRFIWHTGNSGNNRAFIGRRLKDKITVIIFSEGDSKRMEMNEAIVNIIHGNPYTLPKMTIVNVLYNAIKNDGIEKGIALYYSLKKEEPNNYEFGEQELNSLGYRLLNDNKKQEAIQIFELNTGIYPTSSNAFDSLAESWMVSGNKEKAIRYYKKAIELDPYNENAKSKLKILN
jgi:tetratricopeptide (TPR) repeat protein